MVRLSPPPKKLFPTYRTAFGDECIVKTQIKEWYKWFKNYQMSVQDPRSGWASSTLTLENDHVMQCEETRHILRQLVWVATGFGKTYDFSTLPVSRSRPRWSQRLKILDTVKKCDEITEAYSKKLLPALLRDVEAIVGAWCLVECRLLCTIPRD